MKSSSFRALAVAAMMVSSVCGIAAAENTNSQQAQALPGQQSRVAGTVVNSVTGHALAGVRISLADTKSPQNVLTAITSEDGHFQFNEVAPGKYSLQGEKRGFINSTYDQHGQFSTAIVTGSGLETEHLTLRLPPFAVLAGKVLDESGEPVRRASVTLYRENNRSGVSRIQPLRHAATDDQGTFELTPLVAGTYFVSANATPWYALHASTTAPDNKDASPSFVDRSLDVAYPITFYSDATDSESATPIPIRGGDHVEIELHLNPVPSLHIVFRLPEEAQNRGQVPALQQPTFDGMSRVDNVVQVVSPGVYELTGVPAGRYTIRMPDGETGEEWNDVDIAADGQELDTSSSEATSSVKATVQVQGEAKPPKGLALALRNNTKKMVVAWDEVNDKGEVEFHSLSAGKYEVLAGTTEKAYSVIRIASPGNETSGHMFTVAPGSSLSLSMSLVGGSVTVEGVAKQAGRPLAGAMIVLVPKNPEANLDLFRRDQSDLDGTFGLKSVIPGAYTAVAIQDGWDLDWATPGVIAHYAKRGQAVMVGGGVEGVVHLKNPLEVQSR